MMLIRGEEKYIEGLISLWQEVFGDEREYISLLFDEAYSVSECFAESDGEEIISALYLLPCSINYEGKGYEGRYLYAAATRNTHRSKGIMSRLIGEAEAYCRGKGLDFIALVPAEESLYSYYEKFGFFTCMSKYETFFSSGCDHGIAFTESKKSLRALRQGYKGNMLLFGEEVSAYAEKALSFSGFKLYESPQGDYICADSDLSLIYEYIPKSEGTAVGKRVFSPVKLPGGESRKIPFGMLYPINDMLNEIEDIYMNIALD